MSDFKPEGSISADASTLKRFISKTLFAVSTDELRPSMMGVLFQFSPDGTRAVATDGHRLVRLFNASLKTDSELDIIIPAKALNLVSKSFDEKETITRIENAGRIMMKELGYTVELGQRITDKMKEDFGAYMAKILFEVIEQGPTSPMAKQLMVTPPFVNYRGLDQIQHIVFSGGVSEHVYDRDPKAYGDIGPVLGKNMRAYLQRLPKDVLREPIEGIRATVIGAGEYTIQASGNTSYISNLKALPVHGLKVIQAAISNGESPRDALKQALAKFDLPRFTSGLALSLSVNGVPDYQSVRRIAEGIAEVLSEADDPRCPLYLTLDLDVAKSLGGILKDEFKVARDVIAVDGIEVGDLDYIDIGECLGITEVIPVTVKSLMFPTTLAD